MNSLSLSKIQTEIERECPKKLVFHMYRVAQIANYLSSSFSTLEQQKLWFCSLAHDRFRHESIKDQIELAKKWKLEIPEDKFALHGYLAAEHVKRKYEIEDSEILLTLKNHTLLGPKFTKLSSLFFVSDKLDFQKKFYDGKKIIGSYKQKEHFKFVLKVAKLHSKRFSDQNSILQGAINSLKEMV